MMFRHWSLTHVNSLPRIDIEIDNELVISYFSSDFC